MSEKQAGKFFYIRSQPTQLVLEIHGALDKTGASVLTAFQINPADPHDHQLWFFDYATQTIRSKLNYFCLDLKGEYY